MSIFLKIQEKEPQTLYSDGPLFQDLTQQPSRTDISFTLYLSENEKIGNLLITVSLLFSLATIFGHYNMHDILYSTKFMNPNY